LDSLVSIVIFGQEAHPVFANVEPKFSVSLGVESIPVFDPNSDTASRFGYGYTFLKRYGKAGILGKTLG
jgi:hypothetical protein